MRVRMKACLVCVLIHSPGFIVDLRLNFSTPYDGSASLDCSLTSYAHPCLLYAHTHTRARAHIRKEQLSDKVMYAEKIVLDNNQLMQQLQNNCKKPSSNDLIHKDLELEGYLSNVCGNKKLFKIALKELMQAQNLLG
jgi:hypothetical protein